MPSLANFQHLLYTCLGFTANKDCPEQGPEISPWVSLSICLGDLGRQEKAAEVAGSARAFPTPCGTQDSPGSHWTPLAGFCPISTLPGTDHEGRGSMPGCHRIVARPQEAVGHGTERCIYLSAGSETNPPALPRRHFQTLGFGGCLMKCQIILSLCGRGAIEQ